MPSLTLQALQEALREDAKQRQALEARCRQYPALRESLDAIWEDCRQRRRPAHHRQDLDRLFRCPVSSPTTTLVPWKLLPRPVQEKLVLQKSEASCSDDDADEDHLVEVPWTYLSAPNDDEEATAATTAAAAAALSNKADKMNTTVRRPLSGNLTTKLSEYTRGMAGQARPFRPGGGVQEDTPKRRMTTANNNNNNNTQATCEEQIEHYRQILELTRQMMNTSDEALRAKRDKLLLSKASPVPGIVEAGLTYAHVYGQELAHEEDKNKTVAEPTVVAVEVGAASDERWQFEESVQQQQQQRQVSEGMFTRSFFDDDSLFGSSSEEESSEGDDDDYTSMEDKEEMEEEEEQVPILLKEPDKTTPVAAGEDEMEDLDQLLRELTLSMDQSKKQKVKGFTNPLKLAQKQAQYQHDATRKSWATTKTLPMSNGGIETYIPNPAMTFPFELDDFQKQAIVRLERSESVFVAAHTSAGKTVVAEYAVSLAKQRATRCVYTSPIKALSNQKFRDFGQKFGAENVGLITGDLQVNVDDSTVLIMTTEILRSMLYRGADLIRDIEFVIFDEVHYVNDTERGVVWEEVIIMLPSYVNLVFLSATTPNTLEFSDWIGRTKRKPVHVVKTNYRPVPLSHHLWAGNKLHKILEGKGSFLEEGFASATNALLPASMRDGGNKKGTQKGKPPPRRQTGSKQMAWQAQGSKQNWMSLVRYLDRELLTPAVIFSFSKKKCEEIANMLQSLDLNTAKERSAVQGFTIQTMARLSENDAKLPQVLSICEMATRGIGVHHGGLLPILKEMVEILFSRNLIKVLLATETFAMGVNMPAKAVVFNSLRKHDGTQFRSLEPGEYTQMAGRAGRRGLDKVGTVIICCFGEEPPPQQMLRTILTGRSTTLRSQFRLTYNMILNLLRVEEMSVESMIKRSFSEFATQRALTANEYPKLLHRGVKTLQKMEDQLRDEASNRIGAEDIEEYYSVCKEILQATRDVLGFLQESESYSYGDLMQPGRVLLVSSARLHGFVRSPAIVLRTGGGSDCKMVCLVLLPSSYVENESDAQKPSGMIGHIGSSGQRYYALLEIDLDQILLVANRKQKIDAKVILKEEVPSTRGHPGVSQSGDFFAKAPRVVDDPFAGMKPAGKKGGRDDSADFFGRKTPRNVADPFAGMKPMGKKGGRDDPADFFGGMKPLGKKGKGEDILFGSGSAKEDKMVDDVVSFLLKMEQTELREGGIPSADLRSILKRGNDVVQFRKTCDRIQDLLSLMRSFESHNHPKLEHWYREVERRETLREKVNMLQHLLSNESLQLFPDFLQRKAVLRKLGYVDENETVCVKGRVACEVNTCEELIVTEMVFEGTLNDLEPEEIAAVLSALVFQEKNSDEPLDAELPQRLMKCCDEMKRIATNLGQLQKEQGLDIDPGEYCDRALKFGLVHVVYEWALGVPFKNICELSDVQEGSIVRSITRLDELLREVRNCARVVGNPTLYRKVEASSVAIKRDIVFASSLYVS